MGPGVAGPVGFGAAGDRHHVDPTVSGPRLAQAALHATVELRRGFPGTTGVELEVDVHPVVEAVLADPGSCWWGLGPAVARAWGLADAMDRRRGLVPPGPTSGAGRRRS